MTHVHEIDEPEFTERFADAVASLPDSYFVDDTRPSVGQIWEDAEGVLYTIASGVGMTNDGRKAIGVYAFAVDQILSIHREEITKPLARAFDEKGNFLLDRPLRYPNGLAYRPRQKES